MTAKFYAILTNQGAALLANATALGTKLNITQMGVGDGNGTLPAPDATQTKLVNQKRIAPLNMLSVDANNSSQIIAEQVIPENEGGFWIREIGLYDDNGVLIAVANCPETYKPQLQEGSGRTQTIRMVLIVSSTAAVTLKIDPSVVLATRQYVDDKVIEVKSYADDLMKKHLAADNPHTQYALAREMAAKLDKSGKGVVLPAGYNIPFHIRNNPAFIYSADAPGTYTNEPEFDDELFDVLAIRHSDNNSGELTFIAVSKSGKMATASLTGDVFSGWNPSLDNTNTTTKARELLTKNSAEEMATLIGLSQAGQDFAAKESAAEMVKYLELDVISGRLLNVVKITSSGTYIPSPGTKSIVAEIIGGGGASGNLTATAANQNAVSAAGSNGGYAKARYTSGFSSVSVTIGAGGVVNGGSGGGYGGNGGATTFGSLLSCPGGNGSAVGIASTPPFNAGSAQSSGVPTGTGIIFSNKGPNSPWPTVVALGMGSNFANSIVPPLGSYGMGGDGVVSDVSTAAKSGNAGTAGCAIIWEYS